MYTPCACRISVFRLPSSVPTCYRYVKAMKLGLSQLVCALTVCAALLQVSVSSASAEDEVMTTTSRVAAFSVRSPSVQRGYFPAGAKLEIVKKRSDGMVRVRFETSDGKVIEGLCRATDLGMYDHLASTATETVVAPETPVSGFQYEDREWLEGYEGYKDASRLQSRYEVPILIYFHAEWNEECELLWDELLDSKDFKKKGKCFIKVRIDPCRDKSEGRVARDYRVRRFPTLLVIDRRNADPRRIDLSYWSFGKLRTMKVDDAFAEVMGVRQAEEAGGGQSGEQ